MSTHQRIAQILSLIDRVLDEDPGAGSVRCSADGEIDDGPASEPRRRRTVPTAPLDLRRPRHPLTPPGGARGTGGTHDRRGHRRDGVVPGGVALGGRPPPGSSAPA